MESRNKNHIIALDIAYEIMIRSYEPLILTVLHPGGEQYNCLALLSSAGRCFSPKLLINLSGSSIYERNSKIRPYPELYKKNKEVESNEKPENIRLLEYGDSYRHVCCCRHSARGTASERGSMVVHRSRYGCSSRSGFCKQKTARQIAH